MSYEKLTINQVIKKIGNNEIYLPAIQRKFVWKQEQTEKLFDSIQQGYPIGTFLFWFVRRPHIDNYVFYKFLENYHQRDTFLNIRVPNPELKEEIIGVLDGQQRLSSIYLALQGTYAVKKNYFPWENDAAFPRRTLHLNLLSQVPLEEDNDNLFSFKFITDEEARTKNETTLWFKVRDVLVWDKESPPVDDFYDDLVNTNPTILALSDKEIRRGIKRILRDIHSRLVREELINFFKIEEQDLDKILKIFVRVNSGGTILSKTDLLFSTIVANWENGRDEIESFLTTINKLGDTFNFNNDFVMRCCLMLTDCDVLFKVGSFKTENVIKIKDNWDSIKQALKKTIELLVEFGMNGTTLPSQNSILPISYYLMKGGALDISTKKELKKYLFHALLKNVFSGQGDTVLTNLRNSLRIKSDETNDYILKDNKFNFHRIAQTRLPSNKSLNINNDDIDEFLRYKKGNNAFLVLSFLYPNLKYGQVKFHQDHIHPQSQFTDDKMSDLSIPNTDFAKYYEYRDSLPNLQLLEGMENIKKSKTPFADWLNSRDENNNPMVNDINQFLADNYIDNGQSLDFKDFIAFYDMRRENLKTRLERILK
jgi:uncharacterized protein with ParB-like and HNH nuclease domain